MVHWKKNRKETNKKSSRTKIKQMKVNYIIAYRHSIERYKNLKKVLNWLKKTPEIDVTVVEQDVVRRMPPNSVNHILAYDPRDFNRAFGFNVGVKNTESDIYIFGDGDLVLPTEYLINSILSVYNNNFDLISPYNKVIDLNNAETSLPINKIFSIEREGREGINLCGGISIWSRSAIYLAGLWEEDVCTYGWEDNIQTLKMDRLGLNCGEIATSVYHLYHKKNAIDKNSYEKAGDIYKQMSNAPVQNLKNYLEASLEIIGNPNRYTNND